MWKCKCGEENPDSSTFCQSCGTKISHIFNHSDVERMKNEVRQKELKEKLCKEEERKKREEEKRKQEEERKRQEEFYAEQERRRTEEREKIAYGFKLLKTWDTMVIMNIKPLALWMNRGFSNSCFLFFI